MKVNIAAGDEEMKVGELSEWIQNLGCGWASENGVRFGNPEAEVTGVLVCWMCACESIREAVRRGLNVVLCHEDALFPPSYAGGNVDQLAGPVNAARLGLLGRSGVSVIRAHGPLDKFCILDDFGARLGLANPSVKEVDGYVRIYDINPTPFVEFFDAVKHAMGLKAARHWASEGHIVRRVGLPWGGLGLSINAGFIQKMLGYMPDTLIAGETDEYSFYAAQDAGVALIETGHAASENPGLEHFVAHMREKLPDLPVVFYMNRPAYAVG